MSPMSPKEKIAKLEGLLARVRERAEAPRPTGAAPFRAPPADVVQPAAHVVPSPLAPIQALHAEATSAPVPAVPAARVEPVGVFPSLPPDLSSGWSDPPPEPSGELALEASPGSEMDVEVSAELVEVEIDIDEPGMMPAADEVANAADEVANVAAEPEPELSSLAPEGSLPPPTLEVEPEPEPEPEPVVPANELVEPAPSSSPRPIVSVQPEAYEEESAPRHTPPPESGKQVAVPSVKPEPVLSSVPPASIEDHTLIGGWREPGMAIPRGVSLDFSRPPAVRVPAPPPPGEALVPQARGSLTEPSGPGPVGITPEVTKGELPDSARVATFEGAVSQFVPSTFGDLLDATLAL